MTDQPIYAVVYAAKSTKDKHLSIPEQLEDCREMAADPDIDGVWTIVSEFSDENSAAYTGNRGPGLAAAIDRRNGPPPSTASASSSRSTPHGSLGATEPDRTHPAH